MIGYAVGVFDCFHSGHERLLKEAMSRCDRLIIGVHTNEFVESYKRKPMEDCKVRQHNLIQMMNVKESHVVQVGGNHLEVIGQ